MNAAGTEHLMHYGGQAAGPVIFLPQILAGGLHVDEERHVVADRFPILCRERKADVAGDGIDMDRRVGRAPDRRAGDDRVLERLARENIRGLEILMHDLDRAPAGVVGDLRTLAIGRRDRGAAGQRHSERLASAFMVEAVPMVLQWPTEGAEDATSSMNSS